MLTTDPEDFYRAYIACLNAQDWLRLRDFVDADVHHNGHRMGVEVYRRLRFDCSPLGTFLGLPVNGKRVVFAENVFYEIRDGRIARVWSVIDKAAIEARL